MVHRDDPTVTGEPPPRRPDADVGAPLRRSHRGQMVGGVAKGIAERLDVDVSIIRVAFVVLACAWGIGAAIYLAMWAIVPAADDPVAVDEHGAVRGTWFSALLLAATISIGLVVSVSLWGGVHWGHGFGVAWVIFLAIVLVLALRRPVRAGSLLRVVRAVVLSVVTLVVVMVGACFAIVAMSGVPLAGGIGDRVWQPTSLAALRTSYRTAIGSMTVDLVEVPFKDRTYHVTATVAMGQVYVEIPSDAIVDLAAHSGVGTVVYVNDNGAQQFVQAGAPRTGHAASARPVIVLDVEAGIGEVRLYRASAAATDAQALAPRERSLPRLSMSIGRAR